MNCCKVAFGGLLSASRLICKWSVLLGGGVLWVGAPWHVIPLFEVRVARLWDCICSLVCALVERGFWLVSFEVYLSPHFLLLKKIEKEINHPV